MDPPWMVEIEPGLFLGNMRSSWDLPAIQANNIKAIVSLLHMSAAQWARVWFRGLVTRENHIMIRCVDTLTQDLLQYMGHICDFIDGRLLSTESSQPLEQRPEGPAGDPVTGKSQGSVLIHCEMGISRSATVLIAYLMRKHRTTLQETLELVKQKRKVKPNPNFMDQLKIWGQLEYKIWDDTRKRIPKLLYQEYLDKRAETLKSLGKTGDEPWEDVILSGR
ncbi:dual specificity phosphatase [Aspergillus coremiiformis]|uniref:protein-tyrosine-phosphatase n=1 Tax=Aspergillus coremiiformis TaxID=138285 RepID=A0A5N6YSZ5_9EURO|nr:dual specificity phosphatase [Aspergillus coremiiformis]